MRALVTGGAGLIGSHLVDLLVEHGWDVRVLDNLEPLTHPNGPPAWRRPDVHYVWGDVRRAADVEEAFRGGIDVVFHQAAFGGFAPDAALKMTDANALGTVRVLTAARHAGVTKAIVASSQAVYGQGSYRCADPAGPCGWDTDDYGPLGPAPARLDSTWELRCPRCGGGPLGPQPLLENDTPDPVTAYALSKLYTEQIALREDWGFPVVALRYALTYGPRQSVSNPYTGIASIFATRLLNGQPPVIYEDGLQTRDFTYVGDVAAANLLVAGDPRADGRVLNVGTGHATTVLDFARLLQVALVSNKLGTYRGPIYPSGRYRPGDARHVVTNPGRLRVLGWQTAVGEHGENGLAYGLVRYVRWFIESGGGPVIDASAELAAAGIVRG